MQESWSDEGLKLRLQREQKKSHPGQSWNYTQREMRDNEQVLLQLERAYP